MILFLTLIILLSYFYFRKIWFNLRKIRTIGNIERISLCIIHPDLILPEVKVKYKYYHQGGLYWNFGYVLLTDFLEDEYFTISFNELALPVLEIEGRTFVTEEHIEHLLLQKVSSLFIYMDPIEPYHSKIDSVNPKHLSVTI